MSEIDELMSLDPLELSSQDINKIIAYQRKARANNEAGIKPKKEAGPKADLSKVMQALKVKGPEEVLMTRRR